MWAWLCAMCVFVKTGIKTIMTNKKQKEVISLLNSSYIVCLTAKRERLLYLPNTQTHTKCKGNWPATVFFFNLLICKLIDKSDDRLVYQPTKKL